MYWQTKTRCWSLCRIPGWYWLPDVSGDGDTNRMIVWGCWMLDWISKEWVEYCERKGCGFADVFEMIERDLADVADLE